MQNTPPPTFAPKYVDTGEDKTVAVVSYLTLIGFIVALIMHGNKKTRLGAFHLRQALGLLLAFVVASVVAPVVAWFPFIGWMVALVVWIGLFVLWILGLAAAASGQMKPLPVLGEYFHKWFATTFE